LQQRVAGVLPIAVDVPRAGTSYRFIRPLVVNEEIRSKASFSDACGMRRFQAWRAFQQRRELRLHPFEGQAHAALRHVVYDRRGSLKKILVFVDFHRDSGAFRKRIGQLDKAAVLAEIGNLRSAAGVVHAVDNFGSGVKRNTRSRAAFDRHWVTFPGTNEGIVARAEEILRNRESREIVMSR
jgi:hypothetical protein